MDNLIGKTLDGLYTVRELIGTGGMAVVYKAYCHRLHRFVAIKVLKRDLAADAEFRRRFHEEAQAVAMLSEFIGMPISLHAESGYTQEQYDIVLM